MSNRLKFRAWDNKYKYMNYKVLIGNISEDAGENWTAHAMYVYPDKVDYKCEPHWANVDQYTDIIFMQFTGLKDKNGRDIFEGDVIRKYLNEYHSIKSTWNDKYLNYDDKLVEFKDYKWSFAESDDYEGTPWINPDADNFEIIGNIYENPELLK